MPVTLKQHFSTFKENLFTEIISLPEVLQNNYLPSLNGIRGIAIILVVMQHLGLSNDGLYYVIFNGALGVDIFFVLSGYLITTLCLKEKAITGELCLKNFYIRRTLRIFPVAYLYLVVVLILNYWLNLKIPALEFLGAAFYILNLSYFRRYDLTTPLAHYWSLATEEQFYIVFPFLIKKSFKIFVYSILFIVIPLPLLCTLQEFYKPLNTIILYSFTHMAIKFQAIAVGCFFSVLNFKIKGYNNVITRYKLYGNFAALFLIFSLGFNSFYTIRAVYINLFISLLIGYLITSNIKPANDIVFKLLNSKILSFLGILSYSIYIWQQIFTYYGAPGLPAIVKTFPYNVIFLFIVASLSYFFYEKRFLKLKAKFKVNERAQIVIAVS